MQQRRPEKEPSFLEAAASLVTTGIQKTADIISTTFAFGDDPLAGGGARRSYVYSSDPGQQKRIREHQEEERKRNARNAQLRPVMVAGAIAVAAWVAASAMAHAEEAPVPKAPAAVTVSSSAPTGLSL